MIKAGIIGGSSHTAGELIRILLRHPDVDLQWVNSRSHEGERLDSVHRGIWGDTDLSFTSRVELNKLDVLFLCTPQGGSRAFIDGHKALIPPALKVIDLSPDFRLADGTHDFTYGLGELNRRTLVHDTAHVAVPGNFAHVLELALLPLAKNLLINSAVHATAIIGSTAEGSLQQQSTHYSWRNDNVSLLKPFHHPQVAEVRQALEQLQQSFKQEIDFVPMRGPFARGIFATIYLDCPVELDVVRGLYEDFYDDHRFTFIADRAIDLKDVVNTNKCLIHLEKIDNKLLITAVIDNMMKGGAGTAVHNMNLLFGLHERTGLHQKAIAF